MNDRHIIEGLRGRDPQALAAGYDQYAESLFDYSCWLLEDRGAAAHAVRDTFIAAGVHATALRLPGQLQPWLYALTRRECLRRHPATPHASEPADTPNEARALAREAVMALGREDRETLILHVRHGLDIESLALVLGLPPTDARQLVDRARSRAEAGLRSSLLLRTDPGLCPELRKIRGERTEPLTRRLCERLDAHIRECPACHERTPQRVSMARVVGVLPSTRPPRELRSRTLRACVDPRLVDYRLAVARHMEPLDDAGFPAEGTGDSHWSAWRSAVAAAVGSLVVAVLLAAAFLLVLRPLTGGADPFSRIRNAVRENVDPHATSAAETYPATSDLLGGQATAGLDEPEVSRPDPLHLAPPQADERFSQEHANRVTPYGPSTGAAARDAGRPEPRLTAQTVGPGGPDRTGNSPTGVPSGTPTSGSSSGSAPPPSHSSSPSPSQGTLAVSPSRLDLGAGDQGQITLTAQGGPVAWSAASSTSCLAVAPGSGSLASGERTTVTIGVTRGGTCPSAGQGTVTFSPDGEQVHVSWSNPPSSTPSPSDTATPSPTE
ncbi:MAG: BACON domain-containing protein [Streptosporangiaceae bacterium]